MPTKKETDTTRKFDPQSMTRFQGWANALMPKLRELFNNPFGSEFFNQNLAQQQGAARTLGRRAMTNSLQNFDLSGMGLTDSPMRNALIERMNRFSSNLGYQGFLGASNQAQTDRWNAGQLGSQLFGQPLETGQRSVEKTSGTGTWLPQVIGAGLALATPFLGVAKAVGGGGAGGGGFAAPNTSTNLSPSLGSYWDRGGSFGSGGLTSPCWVAAELYGMNSPEMLTIRQWLLETPVMRPFVWLYSRIGQQWARGIRAYSWLRKPTTVLFRMFLKLATR